MSTEPGYLIKGHGLLAHGFQPWVSESESVLKSVIE
jgi:hypothetical protein